VGHYDCPALLTGVEVLKYGSRAVSKLYKVTHQPKIYANLSHLRQ
jgi:hypothetical protein